MNTKELITWEEKTELVKLLNTYDKDPQKFWDMCMDKLPRFDAQMFDMFMAGITLTEVENYPENFKKIYEAYLPHEEVISMRSSFRYGVLGEYLKEWKQPESPEGGKD